MSTFILIPVSDREGKELQPVRISMGEIKEYRGWKNNRDIEQTVFFFKDKNRNKLVGDIDVKYVDELFGVVPAKKAG